MTNGGLQVFQDLLKVPALLAQIYGDLAQPGAQQVGKALGTVLGFGNTILWPIQWANERTRICLDSNLKNYKKRLELIPIEKIIPVAPEIGVPIAEKLAYVSDGKLADMYLSLLRKASDIDTVSEAHPSFVNIINNISSDEAQLLELFVGGAVDLEFVTAKWVGPLVYSIAGDFLINAENIKSLLYPENVPAYFSNLVGLGLLSIHYDRSIHNKSAYDDLEIYWVTNFPIESAPDSTRKLKFDRGAICLTNFGSKFIQACHAPE